VASRVTIARLSQTDCAEFIAAAKASRRLHASWVSPPLTAAAFRAVLKSKPSPGNFLFAIRRRDTRALVGCANITNIVRGNFQSGYLGYHAFAGHARQGLMTEGLKMVVRHAFSELGLHRLEANIQPRNAASIALVRACGFSREGFSPRYLKIRGRWQDHERWARVAR
jgi:ribosomal-protein-alanine N-acetyltransferase